MWQKLIVCKHVYENYKDLDLYLRASGWVWAWAWAIQNKFSLHYQSFFICRTNSEAKTERILYLPKKSKKKIRCEKCQKAFCICATQQHSVKWRFSVFSVAFEFRIFNLIFDGFCTQLSCMYCNKVASAENCAICSARERPKTKE